MSQNDREKLKLDKKPAPGQGPRLPDRKPRFIVWIYLAIFMALIIHIFITMNQIEPNAVEYSAFLDQVSKGYVEEVVIVNDQRIDGKYTPEAIREGLVEVQQPQQNLITGSSQDDVGKFTTNKPSDHELIQFLVDFNTNAVANGSREISFDASREENWLGGILTWIIPLGLILAMWIFLMRRMNPGSQVLNIGKNKAVLFDAMGDQTLTFRDVAGLRKAKGEVV